MRFSTQPQTLKRPSRCQQILPLCLTLESSYISCSAPPFEKRRVPTKIPIKKEYRTQIKSKAGDSNYFSNINKPNSPLLYLSQEEQDHEVKCPKFIDTENLYIIGTDPQNVICEYPKSICDTFQESFQIKSEAAPILPEILNEFPAEVKASSTDDVSSLSKMVNINEVNFNSIQKIEGRFSATICQAEEPILLPLKPMPNITKSKNTFEQFPSVDLSSKKAKFDIDGSPGMEEFEERTLELLHQTERNIMKPCESFSSTLETSSSVIHKGQQKHEFDSELETFPQVAVTSRDVPPLNTNILDTDGNQHLVESLKNPLEDELLLSPLDNINVAHETDLKNNIPISTSTPIMLHSDSDNPRQLTGYDHFLKLYEHAPEKNLNVYTRDEHLQDEEGLEKSVQESNINEDESDENSKHSDVNVQKPDQLLQKLGTPLPSSEFAHGSEECSQELSVNIITFSPLTDIDDKSVLSDQLNETFDALSSHGIITASPFEGHTMGAELTNCSQIEGIVQEHESNENQRNSNCSFKLNALLDNAQNINETHNTGTSVTDSSDQLREEVSRHMSPNQNNSERNIYMFDTWANAPLEARDASSTNEVNPLHSNDTFESEKSQDLIEGNGYHHLSLSSPRDKYKTSPIEQLSEMNEVGNKVKSQNILQEEKNGNNNIDNTVKSNSICLKEMSVSKQSSQNRTSLSISQTAGQTLVSLPSFSDDILIRSGENLNKAPGANIITFSPLRKIEDTSIVPNQSQCIDSYDNNRNVSVMNCSSTLDKDRFHDHFPSHAEDASEQQPTYYSSVDSIENNVSVESYPKANFGASVMESSLFKNLTQSEKGSDSIAFVDCCKEGISDVKGRREATTLNNQFSNAKAEVTLTSSTKVVGRNVGKPNTNGTAACQVNDEHATIINDKTERSHNITQCTMKVINVAKASFTSSPTNCNTRNAENTNHKKHGTSRYNCDSQLMETSVVNINYTQHPHPPLKPDCSNDRCHQYGEGRSADMVRLTEAYNCPASHDVDAITEQVVPDSGSLLCKCHFDGRESSLNELPINCKEENPRSLKDSPRLYTWTPLFVSENDHVHQNDGLYVSGQTTALTSLMTKSNRKTSIRVGLSKRQKVKHLHQHKL